jgi:hypothetical protein
MCTSCVDAFFYSPVADQIFTRFRTSAGWQASKPTGITGVNAVPAAVAAKNDVSWVAGIGANFPFRISSNGHVDSNPDTFRGVATGSGTSWGASPVGVVVRQNIPQPQSFIFWYWRDPSTGLVMRSGVNTFPYGGFTPVQHANTKWSAANPAVVAVGNQTPKTVVLFAVDPDTNKLMFFVDTSDMT